MKQVLKEWLERYLSDPEAVLIFVLLLLALVVVSFFGHMLAPVFAGLVIAYLLEGMVNRLERMKVPHILSVSIVYAIFIGAFIILLFVLTPLIMRQLTSLVTELPNTMSQVQALLMQLPERYPDFISNDQLQNLIGQLKSEAARMGQSVVTFSISTIPGLIAIIVYLVLVPLLVFFFLLDRDKLVGWITYYLPEKRKLMTQIWGEVDYQLGNYVRGKVLEILIVWGASYIAFAVMELQYAMLLSVLVGLSVIIPFIGVTVVTIPVTIIAFLQWGWSADFAYLMVIYTIICVLDANLLVPLLFSEAVNLHPVAIIVAILFFGGLWGFWGVFFAIPLATLVQAIIMAWPRTSKSKQQQSDLA